MQKPLIAGLAAASLALAACDDRQANEELATAAFGAAFGAISARALGAGDGWIVVAALAGAAAGSLVAQNKETGECAYANGDGTYYTGRC